MSDIEKTFEREHLNTWRDRVHDPYFRLRDLAVRDVWAKSVLEAYRSCRTDNERNDMLLNAVVLLVQERQILTDALLIVKQNELPTQIRLPKGFHDGRHDKK